MQCVLAVVIVFVGDEVPRMMKGDYYPDFTSKMMHKDITLGLDLGKKFDHSHTNYRIRCKKIRGSYGNLW